MPYMVGILYVFMITDNYHHLLLISLRSFQIFEYSSKTIIKLRKVHEIQYQICNLGDYSVNTIIEGDTKILSKIQGGYQDTPDKRWAHNFVLADLAMPYPSPWQTRVHLNNIFKHLHVCVMNRQLYSYCRKTYHTFTPRTPRCVEVVAKTLHRPSAKWARLSCIESNQILFGCRCFWIWLWHVMLQNYQGQIGMTSLMINGL